VGLALRRLPAVCLIYLFRNLLPNVDQLERSVSVSALIRFRGGLGFSSNIWNSARWAHLADIGSFSPLTTIRLNFKQIELSIFAQFLRLQRLALATFRTWPIMPSLVICTFRYEGDDDDNDPNGVLRMRRAYLACAPRGPVRITDTEDAKPVKARAMRAFSLPTRIGS
jgi:hypothetical protein